tara:strand:- start:4280 stop:5302 length:1023 start_codon:yes stop_codon:yes gene_type:complete
MFLDLINLYNKNGEGNRIPLEDFNTECFANILRLYNELNQDFIENFLHLDNDEYLIKTQVRKTLPDCTNCIIDLVFEGNKNVCFIENKIESSEGLEQLERYGKVLDLHYNKLRKHLCYCTKYSDLKNKKGEYTKYNFNQFKWFEIANFLRKYQKDNPLIKEYLNFLNYYKMGQDNTIKAENLLSMENMLKTIEIIEFHIDNCKPEFIELFGYNNLNKNSNWDQLKSHNRFCYYNIPILNSSINAWSEVLYSIDLNSLKLNCQIFVRRNHELYSEFTKLKVPNPNIQIFESEFGFGYYLAEDLGKHLNNINSDSEIKDWFIKSFLAIKDLIMDNPQLNWRI